MNKRLRISGISLLLAPIVYLIAEFITAIGWQDPKYSYFYNWVSDLGVPVVTKFYGHVMNSPWHIIFNSGLVIFGILTILGFSFAKPLLHEWFGNLIYLLSWFEGIGISMVGLFQSYDWWGMRYHYLGAMIGISAGNLLAVLTGIYFGRKLMNKKIIFSGIFAGIFGFVSFVLCMVLLPVFAYNAIFERLGVYAFGIWNGYLGWLLLHWQIQRTNTTGGK